jgi:PAS domain S-box-containing protein
MAAAWTVPAGLAYIGVFLFTGVVCLASVPRVRTIADTEVRYGLVGLLGFTGFWAVLKAVFFVVPEPLGEAAYTVGLISGFATVWAWLYFASAYTGRTLHRNRTLRRLGGAVFLLIAAVKLTNPIHGLYFTTTEVTMPFRHLAIEHGLIHWVSTSLSYVLAAIGLFMIFELYVESGYDTTPLAGLTALLALPVTVDLVAIATPRLINFIYAPIGVAAFAIGVLFVFGEQFLTVRTEAGGEAATIVVDGQDRIQAYSPAAVSAFPELEGAAGSGLAEALPAVADADGGSDDQIVEREHGDESEYYLVSARPMTLGDRTVRVLALSDVTEFERQRHDLIQRERELDRRNELYRAIISASFAFVFQIDGEGRFSFVSPSVEEFLGYTPEALTGEPISTLGSSEEATREAYGRLNDVINDGETVQIRDLPVDDESGDTVYTDVRVEPIYEPTVAPDERTPADVVGAQAMVRDASDRRRREGLITVTNRVLRHNVRNKLTVINGHAEMLAADLDGEAASKADRIVDAGTRLLDLSESARRIESHRELSPEREPLDIAPMLDDALAKLREEYPEVSVSAEIPETAVAETRPRIETALWELLDNAAEHAGAEPAIGIEVTTAEESVSVRVRDDGPGLPEAEQQVLTTGEEGPLVHGAGLGLFLTHWLITNLEGEVSVTATDDGTTVEVVLPTPAAAAAPES